MSEAQLKIIKMKIICKLPIDLKMICASCAVIHLVTTTWGQKTDIPYVAS